MSTKRVCRFYTQGNCTRGEQCAFTHSADVLTPVTALASKLNSTTLSDDVSPFGPKKLNIPCKFYNSHGCSNSSCRFLHQGPHANGRANEPGAGTQTSSNLASRSTAVAPIRTHSSSPNCPFYARGSCKYGNQCHHFHGNYPLTSPDLRSPVHTPVSKGLTAIPHNSPLTSPTRLESYLPSYLASAGRGPDKATQLKTTLSKHICSSVIEFGPGLEVKSVLTDRESTRVIVRNIPEGFSEKDLRAMLSNIYGAVNVRIASNLSAPLATLDFMHVDEAKQACDTLEGAAFGGRALSARLDELSSAGGTTVNEMTVKVTWFNPLPVAYAHYEKRAYAQEALRRVDGSRFNDRILKATFQAPSLRQTRSFTLIVQGFATIDTADSVDIWQQLHSHLRCSDISKHTPAIEVEEARRQLKVTLDRHQGRLESLDFLPVSPFDTKCKAIARYATAIDAKAAVDALHGHKLHYLNNSPIWLSYMPSVKIALSLGQYRALQPRIDSLKPLSKEVRWTIFEPLEPITQLSKVSIRITADDLRVLGKIKVKLESLLVGQVLKDETGAVWDDQLDSEEARDQVEEAGAQAGGFVTCDIQRHVIRVFTSNDDALSDVVKAVTRAVTAIHRSKEVIALQSHVFSQIVRLGISELRKRFGDHTGLDITTRSLIAYVDHSGQLDPLLHFIEGLERGTVEARSHNAADDCPVCWSEVTIPSTLPCDHTYCGGCLDLMVRSAEHFPIVCLSKGCGIPIDIRTIQSRLSTPAFDALLQKSGETYINQRPSEFKPCPTLDCTHIYRPGAEGSVIRCNGCLVDICTACHVPSHDGFTCAERRIMADPAERLFHLWKIENAVKTCPSCRTPVQKAYGCNHMTCAGCNAHWCWECSGVYPRDEIYGHMRQAHGGIGL